MCGLGPNVSQPPFGEAALSEMVDRLRSLNLWVQDDGHETVAEAAAEIPASRQRTPPYPGPP